MTAAQQELGPSAVPHVDDGPRGAGALLRLLAGLAAHLRSPEPPALSADDAAGAAMPWDSGAPGGPALAPRTAAGPDFETSFREFFNYAEDSLVDVEVMPDGRFCCRNINPHCETVMGITAAGVRGLTPLEILGPVAGKRLILAFERCIAEGGLRYEESWNTVRGPRVTDTVMKPLFGEGADAGRVVRILCSMRDVTDRKELEAKLAQAQKMQALGQLAGGVAHDFNNVLQAIEGSVGLIMQRARDNESIASLAQIMLDASRRGSAITRRLLAFARRDELRAEAIDVGELLRGLQEVLLPTLGADVHVTLDLRDSVPPLYADKSQLETVLVNLATNARDAMPHGGRLILRAKAEKVEERETGPLHPRPGSYVRLEIADTGIGMDGATLARATEPFFTTKPNGKGTGLGLAMARGFAEHSSGALSLESEPGRGTVVHLWLPQALEAPPHAEGAAAGAERGKPAERACVLIVDDEETVRETLQLVLQDCDYAVITAAESTSALAIVESGVRIDLLLTDLAMPGMDGLTLIRRVRERRPELPAILLTGYAGDGAALALGAGIDGRFTLLRKPTRARELLDHVAMILNTASLGRTAHPYAAVPAPAAAARDDRHG